MRKRPLHSCCWGGNQDVNKINIMKIFIKYTLLYSILLISLSCKAQNSIINNQCEVIIKKVMDDFFLNYGYRAFYSSKNNIFKNNALIKVDDNVCSIKDYSVIFDENSDNFLEILVKKFSVIEENNKIEYGVHFSFSNYNFTYVTYGDGYIVKYTFVHH